MIVIGIALMIIGHSLNTTGYDHGDLSFTIGFYFVVIPILIIVAVLFIYLILVVIAILMIKR